MLYFLFRSEAVWLDFRLRTELVFWPQSIEHCVREWKCFKHFVEDSSLDKSTKIVLGVSSRYKLGYEWCWLKGELRNWEWRSELKHSYVRLVVIGGSQSVLYWAITLTLSDHLRKLFFSKQGKLVQKMAEKFERGRPSWRVHISTAVCLSHKSVCFCRIELTVNRLNESSWQLFVFG